MARKALARELLGVRQNGTRNGSEEVMIRRSLWRNHSVRMQKECTFDYCWRNGDGTRDHEDF